MVDDGVNVITTFTVTDRAGMIRARGISLEAAQAEARRIAAQEWAAGAPLTISRVTVVTQRNVEIVETVEAPEDAS